MDKTETRKPRQLYLYVGRDSKYNYPALPADNFLIEGTTGSGKESLINNMLLRLLMEYSPNELDVVYWSSNQLSTSPWRVGDVGNGKARVVPHLHLSSSDDSDSMDIRNEELEDVLIGCERDMYMRYGDTMYNYRNTVIIVDEFADATLKEGGRDALRNILNQGSKVSMYVIFVTQKGRGKLPKDICGMFTSRLCLRTDADTSRASLGSDIARHENMPKSGCVYYKDFRTKESPQLLYVPFFADSFLRKYARALSREVCLK